METRAQEFVTEAREHLSAVEQILLSLESSRAGTPAAADERERLDHSLRLVHSLKGDAGFLGFSAIRTLANAMETVLEAWRDSQIPHSAACIETLLVARDRLAALLDDLEHSRTAELGEILGQLEAIAHLPSETRPHDQVRELEWDVNLHHLAAEHSGRLVACLAQLERDGVISHARVELPPHDLTASLPQGAIRLHARQKASSPLPASMAAPRESAISLSIDLSQWGVPGTTPQMSPSTTTGALPQAPAPSSLAARLALLASLGRFDQPQLAGVTADLRSLPAGVILHGTLHTSLTEEQVAQRLGLPSSRVPTTVSLPAPVAAQPSVVKSPAAAIAAPTDADKTTTLRVHVELLDRLMTLIGELTLVRNQSLLMFGQEDGRPRPILQRLNGVTSELQATVLRTRMQPVGNLFGKFPRVVRDLGRQLGKQVEVTLVGRDVELDKTILEQLSDPLTHLVRNSVDHGIELPEQRTAQGKAPTGQITLTARHGDGQVHIEIRDDGRGINPQAVRAKALSLKLKTEAELDRMSQRELLGLILLPGFSTAGQVTDVSGRGVGMDVVKTNLESLEGTLTMDSQQGVGTTMMLRVPLTLAIIPCLMIVVEGDRYAVPQREVVEVVCLHPDMPGRVEQAFDTEVYRLRDRLLPIVRLGEVLNRPQPFSDETKAEILRTHGSGGSDPASIQKTVQYIVVVRHEGKPYGLLVDEVRGTEEIVVKPMQSTMKRVKIFSGATILGDGCVALIANVAGIVEHARVSFVAEPVVAPVTIVRDAAEAHRLLLFEHGPQEQFALPLLQIRRIETFETQHIQRVGAHEYVAVEGVATRILRLDQLLQVSPCHDSPVMHLVLAKFAREPVGLLISRIVDSDSLAIDLQPCTEQGPGVLGAAMVRDRLTLFLDMHYLLEQLLGPGAADAEDDIGFHDTAAQQARVLLIDDTPFFREAVGRYLTAAGMVVTTAVDGQDGLKQVAAGEFELIVCDLEMPVLDGWGFAQQVRQRGFAGPLLALSSLSKAQHESRAKACGFDQYEEKLNPDRLVRTVSRMLAGE
ncbi:MAG: chemotaxis protein CheW [Planctomycetia bacterium]|nr:chemotaxis protein CheW [Planctomycetia bacterium]